MIPKLTLFIIITSYFLYKNINLGILFFIGNIILICYFNNKIYTIHHKGNEYEKSTNIIESDVIEILNNIDKIIFRGKTDEELYKLKNKTNNIFNESLNFYTLILFKQNSEFRPFIYINCTIISELIHI
jgi:hypothetical protein